MAMEPKKVKLADGRVAVVRAPKTRDLIHAEDAVGTGNKVKYACALLARITTIDGKQLVYEDMLDLLASDVDRLTAAANSDFLSSTGESLPDSSNGASRWGS